MISFLVYKLVLVFSFVYSLTSETLHARRYTIYYYNYYYYFIWWQYKGKKKNLNRNSDRIETAGADQ